MSAPQGLCRLKMRRRVADIAPWRGSDHVGSEQLSRPAWRPDAYALLVMPGPEFTARRCTAMQLVPSVDGCRAAEKLKRTVDDGEEIYRRDTAFDEEIALLFPEIKDDMATSFGTAH